MAVTIATNSNADLGAPDSASPAGHHQLVPHYGYGSYQQPQQQKQQQYNGFPSYGYYQSEYQQKQQHPAYGYQHQQYAAQPAADQYNNSHNIIDLAFAGHAAQGNSSNGGNSSPLMPPMPSSPPPPPPQSELLDDNGNGAAASDVPRMIVFHTPPPPSASTRKGIMDSGRTNGDADETSSQGALVPFDGRQNGQIDPSLARIIASQQKIMDRAKKQPSKRSSNQPSNRVIVPYGQSDSNQIRQQNQPQKQQLSTVSSKSVDTGLHPKRKQMKQDRKAKTAGGTIGGAIVGGLVLGPAGVILGGAAGGLVTRKVCKAGEKRAQRKFEQRNVQKIALKSATARHAAFA